MTGGNCGGYGHAERPAMARSAQPPMPHEPPREPPGAGAPQARRAADEVVRTLAASPRMLSWIAAMAEALAVPLLLLDAQGRLLNANMAGARELAHARLLARRGDRVGPAAEGELEAFDALLQEAAARGQRRQWHGGEVNIAPVPIEPGRVGSALLLLVLPAEAAIAEACRLFAYQYGLSEAELAVLLGVVHGRTPTQIARARGTRAGTVRSQLARLRRKCGEDSLNTLLPLGLSGIAATPRQQGRGK